MTTERGHSDDTYRHSISLDDQWTFITDPNETGYDAEWYDPEAEWPDRAQSVSIPHAWQEIDIYRDYTGTGWYRRTVDVNSDNIQGLDVFLRFGAVDYEATVWINGTQVGHNQGGYLPFEFNVSDAISPGKNVIAVSVTDPENVAEIPHGKQGDPWYTRVSGIWQSVELKFRPKIHVTSIEITPDLETDTAHVSVGANISPHMATDMTCEVCAFQDGKLVAQSTAYETEDGYETHLTFDNPAYWSPSSPVLYDAEVTLSDDDETVDRYTDYFGMRSFERDGRQLLLNGKPVNIRGVLEQGFYPKTLYRPPDENMFTEEVAVAKELGFNLIRKHLKPAHPAFLKEADHQGILVWEEPANPSKYTKRSRSEVFNQLNGLICRDYNRPSVVIWSLYNEEWGIGHYDGDETLWTDEEKQQFLSDAYKLLRDRDTTRVICDNSGWAHVETDINDFHRYFVSPDRAANWEADLDHLCHYSADNYATTEPGDTNAPVILSELGTWGLGDLSALMDRYNGEPPWFSHNFLTDPLKRPEGVEERFSATNLESVFGDFDALEFAWQQREYISIKSILEQVRIREKTAGYVLTQLSDIEWEFNGILNYLREEKEFHEEYSAVNAPIAVVAEPMSHIVSEKDTLNFNMHIVNDSHKTLSGQINWSLFGESNQAYQNVKPCSISRIENIKCDIPDIKGPVETDMLEVTFDCNGESICTEEQITVLSSDHRETPSEIVYAEGSLASRFATEGITVTHQLDSNVDIAFVDQIDSSINSYVANGGIAIHIPTINGEMTKGGPFTYSLVPEEESWRGAASIFYQDSPILTDICDNKRLGWEFEGIYPCAVATNLDLSTDRLHVGYVEGWLANWGSPFVERRENDEGSFVAFTFQVQDSYGEHPLATLLCNRLIDGI
ncbi:glycoside hydrolase family 2 protein [Haladaptatus sp. R4]|uniref:glycoside hydrolase family 2 protein n=1 Tax=Haladaptatus sp. R4 TaxID=1679489 RepID=UPI0009ECDB67|nr:sugar-binding domain-containing protein [Haladaptatus sp. R4]